ncbi:MAG: hypothetical protein RIC55_03690 [Pirellulaceae bacterium]
MGIAVDIERFTGWITSEYGDDVRIRFAELFAKQPDGDLHDLLDEALEQVYPEEARRRLTSVKEPFRSDLLFSDQPEN